MKLEPGLEDKKGKKKPHIKKPLNAFMLYMKEMRPKVVAECTLKESAAINQILGRKVSGYACVVNFRLNLKLVVFAVARSFAGRTGKIL